MVLAFSLGTNAQDSTPVDNFKKTDEQLAKVVKKALEAAEKTGDFVIEQAPLLLQEFYTWHIFKSSFFILIGVALLIIGLNIGRVFGEKVDKDYSKDYNEIVLNGYALDEAYMILLIIVWGIGLLVLFSALYNLAFIIVAPKLYLIECFITN